MISKSNILVLNANFEPINMTSFTKGFKLVYKGKAEIIASHDDETIVLCKEVIARPKIIRLLQYIYLPYRKITLSKPNIFKRDRYRCVYCNMNDTLTLDHVMPRSRGGKNTWENLVTCCSKCNSKKGDRTPEEAGMTLKYTPFAPTFSQLIKVDKEEIFGKLS